MAIDMFSVIWEEMVKERLRVTEELEDVRTEIDAANDIIKLDVADLPTLTTVEIRFATDGRKTGEGAGSGTGVLVYYNSTDSTWKRFSDDTTVLT